MKKLFSLLLIGLLAAGCNKEKTYQQDLQGTWQVYKYLYRNADDTQAFVSQYGNYSITFNNNKHFLRLYTNPDTAFSGGTYYFANDDQQLVLVDSIVKLLDTVYVTTVNQETYTIYNLTGANVQLRTDTSELYMNKIK